MSYGTYSTTVDANNTTRTGTGAGAFVLFEAEQDCYVERVIWQPLGDNAATAARVFVNNGGPIATASNNKLNRETTLAQTTGTGETAAVAATETALDLYLFAGQRLIVTVGTAPTAGFDVSAVVAPNYRDFNV